MLPTLIPYSSSTSILEGFLICLLTYLEGVPFSEPSVRPALSIIPQSIPESVDVVSLVLSVDPLVVSISSYGTPQSSSVVPTLVSTFEQGILRLGVHCSFMLPSHMGSHPTIFTLPPIIFNTVMSSGD